jgi:predicted RNase H-like nuclease (RuvC/YqgF family)
MKAKIAVATVSGKAYYLIVNELKTKNIPFISLTPKEPVPIEIKAVITTKGERHLINHERILVCDDNIPPKALINEALQIIQGKEYYDKIVIGIDPGEVFGLAVLADGKVVETGNSFSVEETVNKIEEILKSFGKTEISSLSVKVGDGVPAYKEKLLRILDTTLPSNVILESVREAGTDRYLNETEHRRGLRDIVSATRIAGRNGFTFPRRNSSESNS